jgi:hypothetical protein
MSYKAPQNIPLGSQWPLPLRRRRPGPDLAFRTHAARPGFLVLLYAVRKWLKPFLTSLGVRTRAADIVTKLAPIVAVTATTLAVAYLQLPDLKGRVVGAIPHGLLCRLPRHLLRRHHRPLVIGIG